MTFAGILTTDDYIRLLIFTQVTASTQGQLQISQFTIDNRQANFYIIGGVGTAEILPPGNKLTQINLLSSNPAGKRRR